MPISILNLFKIPVVYSLDLSSDGSVALYSSNPTGIPHLYLLNTKQGSKPRQITSGNDPVMFGLQSPNGDRVVYLQDKDGNELHDLFMMYVKDGSTEKITKRPCRTFGFGWHPEGREVVRSYATREVCGLEICDLKTGENFVLIEQAGPLLDCQYSHDGKWVASDEMGGGKDPKNVQITVVNRKDPSDVINYSFRDGSREILPSWAPDDRELAFISDLNGRNQVVIQEFQGTGRLFLSLEEGEEALPDVQEPCWAPSGKKVYYVVSKHSRSKLYEHPLDGKKKALPFPDGTTMFFKISKDGKTVVGHHSSIRSPHGLYIYEAGSDEATPLLSREYKMNLDELVKPESVWYSSSDGLKIHAWYLPAGAGKSPSPAVIWPHGGPSWQVFDAWSPYLQSISQSGFAVLAPNFRGSTGYGTEFRNMNLSDIGGGDLEDVVAGAKWLAKHPEVDKSKIAIMGGSYGGFMTLMALTKKPEVFAAGIAIVPVTDWLEMYGLSDAAFRKWIEEMFEGPPEKKEQSYRDSSPVNYVSKIKAPVLISCGRNDSRCPIQPIEKFVKKLEKMKHPHEFRIQEKEGHGFARVDANILEVTTAIEYLKKTLLPKH